MEYINQEELVFPEYGRNVQKLLQHAKTIADKPMRQAYVERIVDLMQQINPQAKSLEDQRIKLWHHVFSITNYELDVMPPNGEIPKREDAHKRPEPLTYQKVDSRYRHYGGHVQKLIQKALAMEPGAKRDAFVAVIGSYMKLAYKTWNKEYYVGDDVIKEDLASFSNGQLELRDDMPIETMGGGMLYNKPRNMPQNNNNHRKPNNNRGGRNDNYRNNKNDNRGGHNDNQRFRKKR
ncbi:MAG: DUF4290 domain-containing protein [Saprospiraceae bacterium]|nr:DUF4290 domain-containing protein [Saprospiraceae bacterium]MBP7679448.1 DUF4290 domain-containing protein [Saprospiraceae bacterium]